MDQQQQTPPFHLLVTHLLPPQPRYVAFAVHNICIPAFAVAIADALPFASDTLLAAAMPTALQWSSCAMIGQPPFDRQCESNSCMHYRVSVILLLTSPHILGPFLLMSYDVQAGPVNEGVQLRDETSGEMQHDGTANMQVPFDDTLCMCLPTVLPITFMKPYQFPYPCTSYLTYLYLCPVTWRSHSKLCCIPPLAAVLQVQQSAASASTNLA